MPTAIERRERRRAEGGGYTYSPSTGNITQHTPDGEGGYTSGDITHSDTSTILNPDAAAMVKNIQSSPGYTAPKTTRTPEPEPGMTQAEIDAMIAEKMAGIESQQQQQLQALSNQMGQQSAMYQGQINDLMRRMTSEQQEAKAAQAEYQRKLQEETQVREELDARIQHYTSPEFMTEGAELARTHMRPGQEADQARIMDAIIKGSEQRGMVHSGITPGLQQKAAQHLEEQYAKKGMEVAQQLALMGVSGAEGEWDRLLQGLEMEGGALTGGQAMSWGQLADQMGFAQTGQQSAMHHALQGAQLGQQAHQFGQTHELQQFQAMAPYMLMTQAEQASHARQLLQQMGVPTGSMTEAELQNIYNSLVEDGGDL